MKHTTIQPTQPNVQLDMKSLSLRFGDLTLESVLLNDRIKVLTEDNQALKAELQTLKEEGK